MIIIINLKCKILKRAFSRNFFNIFFFLLLLLINFFMFPSFHVVQLELRLIAVRGGSRRPTKLVPVTGWCSVVVPVMVVPVVVRIDDGRRAPTITATTTVAVVPGSRPGHRQIRSTASAHLFNVSEFIVQNYMRSWIRFDKMSV